MEINGPCPRWGSGLGKTALGLMDDSGLAQEAKEASCRRSVWAQGPTVYSVPRPFSHSPQGLTAWGSDRLALPPSQMWKLSPQLPSGLNSCWSRKRWISPGIFIKWAKILLMKTSRQGLGSQKGLVPSPVCSFNHSSIPWPAPVILLRLL